MRNRRRESLVVAGLLICCGSIEAQSKQIEEKVEKQLSEERQAADQVLGGVLRNNPDIRVAEAKVIEAQAELDRVRLQVMARTVAVQAELRAQKPQLESLKNDLERVRALRDSGAMPASGLAKSEVDVLQAEAALQTLEQELESLQGKIPNRDENAGAERAIQMGLNWLGRHQQADPKTGTHATNSWTIRGLEYHGIRQTTIAPPEPGSMTDRILKAMDQRISMDATEAGTLGEVLKLMHARSEADFPFQYVRLPDVDVNLPMGDLTLGAWLTMIADTVPELQIVVRPYGLLFTSIVPDGGVRLQDVWPQPQPKK